MDIRQIVAINTHIHINHGVVGESERKKPGLQRGRVDYALISHRDKVNILRDNALRLFGEKLK